MVRTTFITAANLADILIVKPHVVSANGAVRVLNKDAAAPNTITPAVTGLAGVTTVGGSN